MALWVKMVRFSALDLVVDVKKALFLKLISTAVVKEMLQFSSTNLSRSGSVGHGSRDSITILVVS